MSNIVQAEFFFVDFNVKSLPILGNEMAEWLYNRMPIKTAIRFLDTDGSITRFAMEHDEVQYLHREALKKYVVAGRFARLFIGFKLRRLEKKVSRLQRQSTPLSIAKVLSLAEQSEWIESESIALENTDRTFSLLPKDKIHELFESIRQATAVWLFVFKPNDLLADKHESVTTFM